MHILLVYKYNILKSVIGEMWCDFFLIYVPTHYSAVFLLHAPIRIKIDFGALQCGSCGCVGEAYTPTNKIIHGYFSHMIYLMSHVTSLNNTWFYKLSHSGL